MDFCNSCTITFTSSWLGMLPSPATAPHDFGLNTHHFGPILLFAGAETSSTTVYWTMMELLNNPEKMNKATNEIRKVIGKNKLVEESDISRFPYLQAVIKETFRYHPAAPLLVPHKAEEEAKINGFTIPKSALIFVNVWAIGRDPSIWENPNVYEPERFLNNKLDYKGKDFALIPFGSGRRKCPGLPLADRMVHLMVATLVNEFDWKVKAGVLPEKNITQCGSAQGYSNVRLNFNAY